MMARALLSGALGLLVCLGIPDSAAADRSVQSLNGRWEFQREGADSWKTVVVPRSFEAHEGVDFDGVGTYRRRLAPVKLSDGARAILHFQAVATECEVLVDGQRVGTHLGGWTPFRIDVTDQLRAGSPGQPHELVVRVDEKVGHNSQGFLPIVAPHFGGIWQDVQLLIVPRCWIDDRQLLSVGDPTTGSIRLEIPVRGGAATSSGAISVRYRLWLAKEWSWSQTRTLVLGEQTRKESDTVKDDDTVARHVVDIPVADWKWWSPQSPHLYEVEILLQEDPANVPETCDRVWARAGFRTMQVDGSRILLNGEPLSVRGMLNWGYAPPLVTPSTDTEHFRTELLLARSLGFNMMKFCLWIPPQRYLDIADEMGMLTWMEYPTWHSKWTADQLPTLEREFTEFFCYDRNHPSVLLRSLTCETGPSADLNVIRALYDRCHAMVPQAIVEDDSSWIGWNRVHDFYDDHPYGNNHTWVATLAGFKQHIQEHGLKPLVLGESISADTWIDRQALLNAVGSERPFWLPRFFDGTQAWLDRMTKIAGPGGLDRLTAESKWYGLLMRKYQIEAYRREVPEGGYVVSVVRDIPSCSMGFLDYLGRPKWTAADWSWHGDTMLLLETDSDRRSFVAGETFQATPLVSHFGLAALENAQLEIHVSSPEADVRLLESVTRKVALVPRGGLCRLEPITLTLPNVTRPIRFLVSTRLQAGDLSVVNEWPMWIVPGTRTDSTTKVYLHPSCSEELKQLFPGAQVLANQPADGVVVATRLDVPLIDLMETGGRVLLFPDGQPGSFPLSDEWFLRGAPYIPDHPLSTQIPRQLLLELQHFDLAGPVIPNIGYLERITPILMLWFTHDLRQVDTQGLVFETQIGRGRMLVSALRHTSAVHAAGPWLARVFAQHVATGPPPRHTVSARTISELKDKIQAQQIDLTDKP